MRATFTGVNASGYVRYWGYHFPCGKPVEIDTVEAIEGVKRHPEFELEATLGEIKLLDPHNVPSASAEAVAKAAKKPRKAPVRKRK